MFYFLDFVSDFGFSPHDDSLLATCSFDNFIKLWRIKDPKAKFLPTEPELVFPELPRRADALQWSPLVSNLMSVVSSNLLRIYDASSAKKLYGELIAILIFSERRWDFDFLILVSRGYLEACSHLSIMNL